MPKPKRRKAPRLTAATKRRIGMGRAAPSVGKFADIALGVGERAREERLAREKRERKTEVGLEMLEAEEEVPTTEELDLEDVAGIKELTEEIEGAPGRRGVTPEEFEEIEPTGPARRLGKKLYPERPAEEVETAKGAARRRVALSRAGEVPEIAGEYMSPGERIARAKGEAETELIEERAVTEAEVRDPNIENLIAASGLKDAQAELVMEQAVTEDNLREMKKRVMESGADLDDAQVVKALSAAAIMDEKLPQVAMLDKALVYYYLTTGKGALAQAKFVAGEKNKEAQFALNQAKILLKQAKHPNAKQRQKLRRLSQVWQELSTTLGLSGREQVIEDLQKLEYQNLIGIKADEANEIINKLQGAGTLLETRGGVSVGGSQLQPIASEALQRLEQSVVEELD